MYSLLIAFKEIFAPTTNSIEYTKVNLVSYQGKFSKLSRLTNLIY